MTAKNRQIFSVLLSLLLVMSGPALAISGVVGGQADSATADCGSMMMEQNKDTSSPSDAGSDCASAPGMACPSTGGLNSCSVNFSFAFMQTGLNGLIDAGSQPVISGLAAIYQDPFLASITPPPEYRS